MTAALKGAFAAGITRLKLPMAEHPLRFINSYLIEGGDGYALVDCGWGTPSVLGALQAALHDAGVALEDIRQLIVTHHHFDHFGLAGTLARLHALRVVMHRLDWIYADVYLRDFETYYHVRDAWLVRNGLDPAACADAGTRVRAAHERLPLIEPAAMLEGGELLDIGGRRFDVVWTPGHTPGHICLHDPLEGVFLSGDHILGDITPHVGLWNAGDGDVLADFLASLARVRSLNVKLALPAHRDPVSDVSGRIDEICRHHNERQNEILEALGTLSLSAAQTASRVPWLRTKAAFETLLLPARRSAVAETLAHLEHLRSLGAVERDAAGAVVRYRRVG